MVINDYQWLSMVINGYQSGYKEIVWKMNIETNGDDQCLLSMVINGYQWLSMLINACQCLSMVINGYQCLLMVINGY